MSIDIIHHQVLVIDFEKIFHLPWDSTTSPLNLLNKIAAPAE